MSGAYPFPIVANIKSTLFSWAPKLRAISNRAEWLGEEFTWTPYQVGISGGGTMTTTPSDLRGLYIKIGEVVLVNIRAVFTTAVAASPIVYLTLPITAGKNGDMGVMNGYAIDGGNNIAAFGVLISGSARMETYRYDGANWGIGAKRTLRIFGAYTII